MTEEQSTPVTSEETKIDYELIGKTLWHEGMGAALKIMAAQTPNKIDDVVVGFVDKIADEIFPMPK